jgi:acetyl esterase/lipase
MIPRAGIFTLALTALTSSPGLAQEAADAAAGQRPEDPGSVTDIIVTAKRYGTRLQDTPLAISALSSQQLEDQGIDQNRDLTGRIPNLFVNPRSNTQELDVLRDDSVLLAQHLEKFGVPNHLTVLKGLTHGFVSRTRMVPRSTEAIADAVRYLRRAYEDLTGVAHAAVSIGADGHSKLP